jgi:two-component system cell cycle response regulator
MTARVLVVDDILANVKLLEARLSAEYFHVMTAHNGRDALDLLNTEHVDVILLDVMMPGMDGFEVCRRIKQNAATAHLPVIMVTALDQPSDKVQGLRVGADDFLTKPINEIALITRVKNLARLKVLNDEVCRRALANAEAGLSPPNDAAHLAEGNARILIVEDDERAIQRVMAALARSHTVDVEADIQVALAHLAESQCDLAITSLSLREADGLRFCGQIRSTERLRHLPIIAIADRVEEQRLLRALDMGVNDYLVRPIDRHELLARVRTQLRRKGHYEHLKSSLDASVELAITDPLTGLFNRRYLEANITKLVQRAGAPGGGSLSLLLADIDHFKSINDTHGHLAGDHVLREFACRLRRLMRASDLVCRLGGEEFIVVMPDTPLDVARQVGERVCATVAAEPFRGGQPASRLSITASVGVAALGEVSEGIDELFNRVDLALYAAKREGRNRVVADAA